MPENRFVGQAAQRYDDVHAPMFDRSVVEPTVGELLALADGGPILEFAIGTGRLALPLAAKGASVSGIELSADMIAELRRKPGGAALDVVEGDMANARLPGDFALVVLAFNTIGNLTTRREQANCVLNAAAHLRPGGRFVVEVGVPTSELLEAGHRVFAVDDDYIGIDELLDAEAQLFRSRHLRRSVDGRWDESSHPFRYVWPAELDEMALAANLHLEHRWADWHRTPFTESHQRHVSVWRSEQPTTG